MHTHIITARRERLKPAETLALLQKQRNGKKPPLHPPINFSKLASYPGDRPKVDHRRRRE